MTTDRLQLIPPPCLPQEHFQIADRSIMDTSGDAICTYCPESRTGAVFSLGNNKWAAWCPLSLPEFLSWLASAGIIIDSSADYGQWLRAVSAGDVVAEVMDRAKQH